MRYTKNILSGISALCLFTGISLLECSCSLFQDAADEEKSSESLISQVRFRLIRQEKTFICLYAVTGEPYLTEDKNGTPQGIEPDLLRRAAAAAGLRIHWVRTDAARLAPLLRDGHGDIAAGALRTPQIRSRYMIPVGSYGAASDFEGKGGGYAFMIRENDPQWQDMLEKAFARIDMSQVVSREAAVLSTVKVQVREDHGTQEQPIAVRLSVGHAGSPAEKVKDAKHPAPLQKK